MSADELYDNSNRLETLNQMSKVRNQKSEKQSEFRNFFQLLTSDR